MDYPIQMEPGYASYPRRGPSTGSIVFVAILTSVVSSATTVFLIERFGIVDKFTQTAPATVEVPQLLTMKREAADEVLRNRGLRLLVGSHREDPAEKGVVIEQQPLSGSRMKEGDAVTVTLSSGSERIEIPPVVGKTKEAAQAMIEQAGLVVGDVHVTPDGQPGTVTATDPEPGTAIDPMGKVALTVAEEDKITVPDLKNLHVRKAKEKLAELQLKVGSIKERYNRRKRGYLVLKQTPEPGTEVSKETEVSLVINQGD
ncbi:MAG: PASTA domain-containing protein [Myxococcales bacterium]|nr:PASTA domain-containing protein [Myxococcales bacterium]